MHVSSSKVALVAKNNATFDYLSSKLASLQASFLDPANFKVDICVYATFGTEMFQD